MKKKHAGGRPRTVGGFKVLLVISPKLRDAVQARAKALGINASEFWRGAAQFALRKKLGAAHLTTET